VGGEPVLLVVPGTELEVVDGPPAVVVGELSPPPPHATTESAQARRRGIDREARISNLVRQAAVASLSQSRGR
jgi:hypothetical protein